jgi:hypothetical protein
MMFITGYNLDIPWLFRSNVGITHDVYNWGYPMNQWLYRHFFQRWRWVAPWGQHGAVVKPTIRTLIICAGMPQETMIQILTLTLTTWVCLFKAIFFIFPMDNPPFKGKLS